jgi:hypothetical protein
MVLSYGGDADGRLASGGRDGKIKLWLVDEQQLIAALSSRRPQSYEGRVEPLHRFRHTPWQPKVAQFSGYIYTPPPHSRRRCR